jgi:leader peptidase (prepilin peptidase) / N-methyltransferase
VTPDPWIIVWVGLGGLIIGSFLNVCAHRLPRGASIVSPPSRCTTCGRLLSWYDNVPVLSYAVLGGKCRSCRAPISIMYPLVEIITAAVFVVGYWRYGLTPLLAIRLLFACAMIVLFVIDLQHRILPNRITIPGIVAGFVFSLFAEPGWIASLLGIAVGGGVLLAVAEVYYRIRHEEGLGMGDVKMLAMIGAFLGWKLVLLTLLLASFLGSLVGVAILIVRRESLKYALPFGTFLAAAALVAAVGGDELIAWYLGFYQR